VEEGYFTPTQAAAELAARGYHVAHDAFVERQLQVEAQDFVDEQAEWLEVAPISEYAQHIERYRQAEREQAEADRQKVGDDLARAKLAEMSEHFRNWASTTPGAHVEAPMIEQRLVQKLIESDQGLDAIPDTAAAKQRLIEQAAREISVTENLRESLKAQVDTEWRLHRKNSGARDGLMTQADIASAEAAFKEARFNQLAETTMVPNSAFEPGPTSEEIAAAETAKFAERQQKSTSFHEQVAGIAERGVEASGADRGEARTERNKAYREALEKAEREAAFGEYAEVKTGYGADGSPVEAPAKGGQIDEYGGAFPGFTDA
jgi:hypothetical protein